MPYPPTENSLGCLNFFIQCEDSVQRTRAFVASGLGVTSMRSCQRAILRDLDYVHNLPLQALNDKMKRFPFVDPGPLDEMLKEMVDAVLEWLQVVTNSDWLVDVCHCIGRLSATRRNTLAVHAHASRVSASHVLPPVESKGKSGDDLELDQLGRFLYPIPLKLRDLQTMVRPFMEVRSTHHIAGLDAIVGELVRGLLQLYHTLKAWDDALMWHIEKIALASPRHASQERVKAILDLCATMEMDMLEAKHRMHHIDPKIFEILPSEVDVVCQKMPLYQGQQLLRGPPTASLDHGGLYTPQSREEMSGSPTLGRGTPLAEVKLLDQTRQEALTWWHDQQFTSAISTRILATTLLQELLSAGFHPDPHITEMLPRVLEALFGQVISIQAYMNRLLPRLGGYIDSHCAEVPNGAGLPLLSNLARVAETIIMFCQTWDDLVGAVEEHEAERRYSKGRAEKGFNMSSFLDAINRSGHSADDIYQVLDGTKEVPRHIREAPAEERRYRVDDREKRRWELLTHQFYDSLETLDRNSRDLGPYVLLELDHPDKLKSAWSNQPAGAWYAVNPDVARAAARRYGDQDPSDDSDEDYENDGTMTTKEALRTGRRKDASDFLCFKLVEYPSHLARPGSASAFVRYFAEEGRVISRAGVQGLPPLPWSFGSDERNTLILDVPDEEVAAFHCVFVKSMVQPHRACIVPLGDSLTPTYIVCPKYQPLWIQNGDRVVCHQWNFEIRTKPKKGMHSSSLQILTDEGDVYDVPQEGCHVGAGGRSSHSEHQPLFPKAKMVLNRRLNHIAAVHFALMYHAPMDRWTLVDHSPEPFGCMLQLKHGIAYPLSKGLRVKLGPVVLEADLLTCATRWTRKLRQSEMNHLIR